MTAARIPGSAPGRLGFTRIFLTGSFQSSAAATVPVCVVNPKLTTRSGCLSPTCSRISCPKFTSPRRRPISVARASPRWELCAPARHTWLPLHCHLVWETQGGQGCELDMHAGTGLCSHMDGRL